CAMTVNGRPRWTCRTHVATVAKGGRLTIGPLANLPVIKDLAADLRPFFDKWQEAKGAFVPSQTRDNDIARVRPDSAARIAADARDPAMGVINCAIIPARWQSGALEPGLPGPGGAHPRLDVVERRARRRKCRASAGRRRLGRLPRLPLAPVLPRTLPAAPQSN